MQHYQEDEYIHYGGPRRKEREKKAESLFKETVVKHFTNLWK